ncbi:putative uncharacterized protein ZNRD1-AS1 [Petaurus breviceps papuanus]|uniref:putative uncharacterized protein ZNRD1-AS1 n=1 Tax=Petaurus breviceps papuanus TaxID=3040969 RepID=UPI0036DD3B9F
MFRLAWVKNTQDPRIARGLQSPLEKKILSLGGIRSTAAQRLLAKKHEEENEAICKFKSASQDYQFSQAYSKRQDEIMEEPQRYIPEQSPGLCRKSELIKEEKIWAPKKWDYLVNERELKLIERHIYRAKHARNLRNKTRIVYRHDISRKIFPPKTWTPESKEDSDIQKRPKTREQMRESEAKQIKEHQKRMMHGRKVMQRHKERCFYSIPSEVPLVPKPEAKKEQMKLYEWVAAYPLLQPRHGKRLEIRILIEKSKFKEEEPEEDHRTILPVFLKIPPFLKSQIDKMKAY